MQINKICIRVWSNISKTSARVSSGFQTRETFETTRPQASPPQRFKRSLYQSAVRSVPQTQNRMDRSGGEPLPDVCRFLVHPCRFLVHRWIYRLWLNLTAWNSQKPIANYVATVWICFFFWSLISYFLGNEAQCFTLKASLKPVGVLVVHVVFSEFHCSLQELYLHGKYEFK